MSKKTLQYLVFFAILIGGFYIAMVKLTDFEEVKLPVLNAVQPYQFTRQDGHQVTQKETAGKVYVAEYFFTTCKGICPKMNKNMKAIYDQFKTDSSFMVLSHTVNPETDSLPVLKHYADSLGAQVTNWWFLTGSKSDLYKSARESYLLDDPKNSTKNIEDQFLHTQFFALVDKQGRVRGIYDGIKKEEVSELIADIKKLISE